MKTDYIEVNSDEILIYLIGLEEKFEKEYSEEMFQLYSSEYEKKKKSFWFKLFPQSLQEFIDSSEKKGSAGDLPSYFEEEHYIIQKYSHKIKTVKDLIRLCTAAPKVMLSADSVKFLVQNTTWKKKNEYYR